MSGFFESALSAVCGLIEAGPVKIDNKLVEGLLGVAAVGVAGYTAYKVLNDKGAAENLALLKNDPQPQFNPQYTSETMAHPSLVDDDFMQMFGPLGYVEKK